MGGSDYSYLYRIVPADQRGKVTWTQGNELLPNSGFEVNSFAQWETIGSPQADDSSAQSHSGTGAAFLSVSDQLRTTVSVTPTTHYLLSHSTRSANSYSGAQLHIEWRDAQGRVIGTSQENIPALPSQYRTLSMLATAPANAATATVYAKVFHGEVWFDDFSLRVAALP